MRVTLPSSSTGAPTSILAWTLLATVLLAGCTGSSGTPDAGPDEPGPARVTDPTNYTYVDNASFATGGHVHDYWGGAEALTVLDRADRTGSLALIGGEDPSVVFAMQPWPGRVVPQGTATVEVSVSWVEEPGATFYREPTLWVRTAADRELEPVQPISNGDTVTVETTNRRNDLPHRQLSGWAFGIGVLPDETTGVLYWNAEVTLTAVAERGLQLPVFPAHPDLWQGRAQIPLLDVAVDDFVWQSDAPGLGSGCFSGDCPYPHAPAHRPDNGTVVPFDADRVVVRLTSRPTAGAPGQLDLRVHGADVWNYTRLAPDEVEGETRIYEIPVTATTADGPYNEQSLWRFIPAIDGPVEDGVYAGGYRLEATAVRAT